MYYNLAPAIKESRINWPLTHKLFKRTPHLRHDKLTRIFSYRIKNINHSLPHGDLKHKHYPKLYTDPNTRCPLCNLYEDTNCHRSICTGFNSEIISILRKFWSILFSLLKSQRPDDFTDRQINRFIDRLTIFNEHNLLNSAQWSNIFYPGSDLYLIDHNIFPSSIYDIFKIFFKMSSATTEGVLDFVSPLMEKITSVTWSNYRKAFKRYELSLGITQKKKLKYNNYRQRQRSFNRRLTSTNIRRTRNGPVLNPVRRPSYFDTRLWIRWTSSNFLHGGSWQSHSSNFIYENNLGNETSFYDRYVM